MKRKAGKFVYSDGGRSGAQRGVMERNDCTVRATALGFRLSYDDAHELLECLGRVSQHGFQYNIMARYAGLEGYGRYPLPTLGPWLRKHGANGRWLVRIKKHIFYVENGTIFDERPSGPTTRVWTAWRLPD